MSIIFSINGTVYEVNSSTVPADASLNTFIRTKAELSGTKFMCSEGGCGACIVNVNAIHPVTKDKKSWAVNSCLTPVFSCHGYDITTVEGIGNKANGFHTIQQRLAYLNGTQCGYCTPGMVMNMYSLLESKNGKVSMNEVENSFGGNICRCTGYRPILDAFKSFAYDADEKLIEACKDIEDLTKTCPKTGSVCAGLCHKVTTNDASLKISFDDKKQWYQITKLEQLFPIFEKINDIPYMLVAGNTAHGVYRRKDDIEIFIDITRVEALRNHSIGANVTLGGNMSLTETMEVMKKASMRSGFQYLKYCVDHIDLIANVPVRNSGTIAGNLSIKHQNVEFPSDMFLILEAVGAKLTIAESNTKNSVVSVADYLNVDMKKKIILNVVLPALDQREYTFRSYKIMPRAQNAHAYVNAAFLLKMNGGTVSSARICFGGISPNFIHATATENLLIGNDLHTNETLQNALHCLLSELNPDWVLPDACPEYRKQLAAALFYKFVLGTCPSYIIKQEYVSGGGILKRPISSGKQEYDSNKHNYPLTQNIPKYEGLIQCSGELEYVNDLAPMKNELWGAFVQATEVHATVESVDVSDAMSIPGVRHYFSAKDIPGANDFFPKSLGAAIGAFAVEEIFLGEQSAVLYHGQPVGIILADTFALANKAAKKVKISYKLADEGKKIITSLHDAHELQATDRFALFPYCKLTPTKTLDTSNTKKVIGSFDIGAQYHYTMEPQTTICRPAEDGIEVISATQWVDYVQIAVSKCLNVQSNKVNMAHRRIGGAYGAKASRSGQVACACAIACQLTNRPVRFVLTMESNMETVGKRLALLNEYDIDVDDDGKIVKMTNVFSQDFGCSTNENMIFSSLAHMKNCYENDTWSVTANIVSTNAPSHTFCRAPGSTEGIAMIENIMEHIARVTGKDPLTVRMANIPKDNKMREILTGFIADTDFYSRKAEIDEFNLKNRWRKRGIAIVPMDYHQPFFGSYPVFVTIYHDDGSVAIAHGGIEMGQGINTKVAQVAAHVLQIPLSSVSVKRMDNVTGANSFVSAVAIASESVCWGVKKACEELLERMKPVRDELNNPEWNKLVQESHSRLIELSCKTQVKKGDIPEYTIYGCSCAEVEIDLLSGNVLLRRVDVLEDTGESMSPGIDIGQVEGAYVMGIGYWLTESVIFGKEKGELLTNRTWTYKTPGAKDIPVDFRIKFLKNSSNTTGVFRSKATGEAPLCMSIVVIFALRHALESARRDAGLSDEWFNMGAPSTTDLLFLKAGNSVESYKLQ